MGGERRLEVLLDGKAGRSRKRFDPFEVAVCMFACSGYIVLIRRSEKLS